MLHIFQSTSSSQSSDWPKYCLIFMDAISVREQSSIWSIGWVQISKNSLITSVICLIASPVIHTDETGMKVGKAKFWLHVVSTKTLTLYGIFSEERSRRNRMHSVCYPYFFGIAVHDFWESYLKYPCKHAYYNAHILRELTRVEEETHQQWAC